jgi:hypothetical protein
MCDLIRKLQSADKLRSSAGLSTCYRPYAEFLEPTNDRMKAVWLLHDEFVGLPRTATQGLREAGPRSAMDSRRRGK